MALTLPRKRHQSIAREIHIGFKDLLFQLKHVPPPSALLRAMRSRTPVPGFRHFCRRVVRGFAPHLNQVRPAITCLFERLEAPFEIHHPGAERYVLNTRDGYL